MKITICDESPNDVTAVDALVAAAFRDAPHSNQCEDRVVRRLRASGDLTLSLVARTGDLAVGYAAVSPVAVGDADGWYGLGPLAITPTYQDRGIGSRLMREVLLRLREMNAAGCVAVGEAEFYRRFGFKEVPGLHLPGTAPEHFLAIVFTGRPPRGEVSYRAAFHHLDA